MMNKESQDDYNARLIFQFLHLRTSADKQFDELFEIAPDPMLITQGDGVIQFVNARWCALLGGVKQDWIGKKLMEMIEAKKINVEVTQFKDEPETGGRMLVIIGSKKTPLRKWDKPQAIILDMKPRPRINPAILKFSLTRRDLEIMSQVSTGATDTEIAAHLGCAPFTVTALKHLLYAKLHVTSDVSLVQRGNDLKLLGKNGYWYR